MSFIVSPAVQHQLWRCVPVAKAAGSIAEAARIRALIDQLDGKISRAFMDAVNSLSERVDLKAIADLLEQGRVSDAIHVMNDQLVMSGLRPLSTGITQAAIAAGVAAADAMASMPGFDTLDVVFDVTNPGTINFLRTYEMNLIREMTADVLASVRAAINAGVLAGRNPLDIARDVRDFIGLTERQTQAVSNFRRMLENLDSDALLRELRDRRFDSTIERAIAQQIDLSPEQIDRMVQRYTERYLKYRSETIARTESIRAVSAGNHLAWKQAATDGKVDADQVIRLWVYTHDGKTRPAHVAIPGMNPDGVGLDEAFDSPLGPIMYPGDPAADIANVANCRCAVVYRVMPSIGARGQPAAPAAPQE